MSGSILTRSTITSSVCRLASRAGSRSSRLIVWPSISTRAKPLRRSTSSVLRIGSGESPLARSPASSARALPFLPFALFALFAPFAPLAAFAARPSAARPPRLRPSLAVARARRHRHRLDLAHLVFVRVEALQIEARERRGRRGHDRHLEAEQQARALRHRGQALGDRLGRLAHHVAPALPADRAADAREQQAQIVVNLGRRADRRARIADAVLLTDGDGRRNAFHVVDIRPLHALQELARVGRQRLDVAALTFRVDRIECQRRLPRSADARHNRQPPRRERHVDVLQVVGAGTPDDDGTKARAGRIVHSRNRNPDGGLFDDGRNRSC